jgi:hypothetical protein
MLKKNGEYRVSHASTPNKSAKQKSPVEILADKRFMANLPLWQISNNGSRRRIIGH